MYQNIDAVKQQKLIERVCETAARHALQADRLNRLSDDVADAITQAGFARHFVPHEHGGQQGTFSDLSLKTMAVATECTSTAWCAVIYAVAGRMAAYLPQKAQQEIWAHGADVRIAASFRSTGDVQTIKNGWRLSGTWHYLSGIEHAQWVLLCIDPKEQGQESRFAAIPAGVWQVLDDWHTLGMRGTGSHSIMLNGVSVPEHMTFIRSDLGMRYSKYAKGSQYQVSPIGADPQLFMSCAFGAALSALQQWRRELPTGSISHEQGVAYSSVETALDICWLLLEKSCRRTDEGAMSSLQVARHARDAAFSAKILLEAITRLFYLGGTHAHLDTNSIQRVWRDIQTLAAHIGLRYESNFINYANLALKD